VLPLFLCYIQNVTIVRYKKKRYHRYLRWRPVDIAVASVIGVASSIIFWAADFLPFDGLQALIPGLGGLLNGLWLFAGPLAAIIIRKPGAAFYTEFLAAFFETFMGDFWGGVKTLLPGIIQGLGAEIAFCLFFYCVWNIWTTLFSGALSGVFCWLYSFLTDLQAIKLTGPYGLAYLYFTILSGTIVAGLFVWIVYKKIAMTGALDRFESGRQIRDKQSL